MTQENKNLQMAMETIKSNNIKCESICTGYKWLCDNCIKNLNNKTTKL